MNDTIENFPPGSGMSFLDKAAWYALLTPLAYVVVAIAASFILDGIHGSALTMNHIGQIIF